MRTHEPYFPDDGAALYILWVTEPGMPLRAVLAGSDVIAMKAGWAVIQDEYPTSTLELRQGARTLERRGVLVHREACNASTGPATSEAAKETGGTMCGRVIDPDLRNTSVEFSQIRIQPFPRRWNVKPTQEIVVVAKDPLEAMMARWGLVPSWHGGELSDWKATTFNARIEDAKEKPTFRQVWRYGRCLVPVAGFYEWTGPKGQRQPHVFLAAGNEETLYLAGLASRWHDLLTCTILTRAANETMGGLHDRMPVILDADEREAWLGGSDDTTLGARARLRHHPVAPFGIADDGPELIEELQ